MDSISSIAAYIPEIRADSSDEVFVGFIGLADVTCHDRLDGGAQRRAVCVIGARCVVVVINLHLLIGELIA